MTSHLLGLRAENFKRLTLVDVTFDSGVVAIMGSNEAGKSSLLDALEVVIAGRRGPKLDKPVHTGADSARIVATFDDIVVTRTYKGGDTKIEVKAADGRRVGNAEDLLRALYSHVALDPLAFSRLTDAEQVATLLPLIGFDPAPLDKERDETFELRTAVNRDARALAARVEAAGDPHPNVPVEELSVADLTEALTTAIVAAADGDALAEAERRATSAVVEAEHTIAELTAKLAEWQTALAERVTARDAATAAVNAYVEPDVEAARTALNSAEETNRKVRRNAEISALRAEHAASAAHADELTAKLADIKARKEAALSAATMPVPGLSIDDESGVLTLAGEPFSQASTGVKIRTGTAIAMALNPDLRLIVIRDASLLDAGNRTVIDKLARDNDFLVLMEIADENSPVGIVIEEGAVKEIRS